MQNIFRCFCGTVKLRRILLAIVVGLCLGGILWFSVQYYCRYTEIMLGVETDITAMVSPANIKKIDIMLPALLNMGVLKALHEGKKDSALWRLDSCIDNAVHISWLMLQKADEEEVTMFLKTVKELRQQYPRVVLPKLDDKKFSPKIDKIIVNADNLNVLYELKKGYKSDFGSEAEQMHQMANGDRADAMANIDVLKAIYEENNEKAFSILDLSVDNGVVAAWEFVQNHKGRLLRDDVQFLKQVKELRRQYPRVISSQLEGEEMQKRVEMATEVDGILGRLDELEEKQKQE